jgi:hypothetical protein
MAKIKDVCCPYHHSKPGCWHGIYKVLLKNSSLLQLVATIKKKIHHASQYGTQSIQVLKAICIFLTSVITKRYLYYNNIDPALTFCTPSSSM